MNIPFDLNEWHKRYPGVGDYWHERFVPVALITALSNTHVTFINHVGLRDGTNTTETMTREEFIDLWRYESIPGYYCDVIPQRDASTD